MSFNLTLSPITGHSCAALTISRLLMTLSEATSLCVTYYTTFCQTWLLKQTWYTFLWKWGPQIIKWTNLEHWLRLSRNTGNALLCILHDCRSIFQTTTLYLTFKLNGQTDCWPGLQCLLTIDGVILDMSQWQSISALWILNYLLSFSAHVIYST